MTTNNMSILAKIYLINKIKCYELAIAIILIFAHVSNSVQIGSYEDAVYFANGTGYDVQLRGGNRYARQTIRNGNECEIPTNPHHTHYKIFDESRTNYKPGDYVMALSILGITCNKGYHLQHSAANYSVCIAGNWHQPPPACLRTCSSLISTTTTRVTCMYKNSALENCLNPVMGTIATLSCNALYEEPNIQANSLRVCREGKWYPPISQCFPTCGIKHPQGKANIVNGRNAVIGDYPWQVGIYKSANQELICGGSVIKENIILSAAHCVTDYSGNVLSVNDYLIAAGKYFRNYGDTRDTLAQYSNILSIHVPDRYTGITHMFAQDIAILILTKPLKISLAVQPVCIELDDEAQNLDYLLDSEGIVTGWGFTKEGSDLSEVLKELTVPYVPFSTCLKEVPASFKRYITSDKICGGYIKSGMSVCGGDSGGSLVFNKIQTDRFFVRGIVSTSPATEEMVCDSNQFSVYTSVTSHINFVRILVAQYQIPSIIECTDDDCANEINEQKENEESIRSCRLPDNILHGKYSISGQSEIYKSGNNVSQSTILSLSCDTGYKAAPSGAMKFTCSDKGQWSPAPEICTELGKFRVVCYYGSWSVYRAGIGKFGPEDINPHLCSHIVYAFGGLTKEGTLIPTDEYGDIQIGGYAKFTGLKTRNKDLKVMISFGGASEGLKSFPSILADSNKRRDLIKNSIIFLRKHNFDGLDLAWQFPQEQDRNSYATLIQEFREEYEKESIDTNRPRLLFTITAPIGNDNIRNGYDIPKLTISVDWFNVLTYNYGSTSVPYVKHHSQLYGVNDRSDNELNVDYSIRSYLNFGAESQKLVLGVPTFGTTYNLSDPSITDLGSPSDGSGLKGDQTNESGILAYYEICKKIKDDGWIVKQPYPNAMGPYAYKGNQWVGYDDENIIRQKSKYVAENKLGGILFWVIEYDDFKGTCSGKKFPLIQTAKEALVAELG